VNSPFNWDWVKDISWQVWALVLVTIIICIAVRT